MYTIPRLQKWYGAATWLAFSLIGAVVISHYMGATNYVQNWLGACFKVASAAYLAHWIALDLLGTPKEHEPDAVQLPSIEHVAATDYVVGELASQPISTHLTLARAIVIAAAMVSVCLAT